MAAGRTGNCALALLPQLQQLASGERQMFLCRIAAGQVEERTSPDESIRRPKNLRSSKYRIIHRLLLILRLLI